ncbi:Mut7-C ubiquitin/RNAse domain-containing protein [Oscillatoria salina]|uniref:Mut7-C ubiquitin/RNAse domain-containing protein n=1 Tax=Oscillatoria salina TaxID=331517 RepID=UPI0013BDEE84|nr:Mut7-C ubiquitin/RNAse domain-containing protein [Oscillatoria salina]MBZ8179894.1 Mut7-C ubiquitin/RNAse domain-containing protein [Oscillatoria salina IIICB1]NET87441.1 Mut7-C ubiquitin/RNAse domain-containing protein [Kamptonema sp. SIO1D9]
MGTAEFQFFAELNYFLAPSQKGVKFSHYFKERGSIKDTIESLGVPHPEVDSIVVNGESVDFSYLIADGDRIQVYPISTQNNSTVSLRPPLAEHPTFVLDVHLGKLCSSLRMLGFDTLYRNDYDDEELATISADKNRILLTRDKGLLMRSIVTYGYYVRSTKPEQQLTEVMQRFDLFQLVKPFQRCIRCNGQLQAVEKQAISAEIPPTVRLEIEEFHRCQDCHQIYWKGSHYEKMQKFINQVLDSKPSL